MTLGLVVFVSLPPEIKVPFSILLSVLAGVLTLLGLRENVTGIEFFTITPLPILFTLGMAGILYHFPNFSLFFKLVFWLIYSFFFYIVLLSANIFNVAAEKPIPLVRASYTVSFLVTLFTIFPLYTAVFKSNPSFVVVLLLVEKMDILQFMMVIQDQLLLLFSTIFFIIQFIRKLLCLLFIVCLFVCLFISFLILFLFVRHPLFESDIEAAISDTCINVDLQFLEYCRSHNIYCGTTAVGALVTQNGRKLTVFNIGDSEAILYRDGEVVDLTTKHSPNRPDESERIKNAQGWITEEK